MRYLGGEEGPAVGGRAGAACAVAVVRHRPLVARRGTARCKILFLLFSRRQFCKQEMRLGHACSTLCHEKEEPRESVCRSSQWFAHTDAGVSVARSHEHATSKQPHTKVTARRGKSRPCCGATSPGRGFKGRRLQGCSGHRRPTLAITIHPDCDDTSYVTGWRHPRHGVA